jgi:hypothetical protein
MPRELASLAPRLEAESHDKAYLLAWCREVNERCLEMLVRSARQDFANPFPLATELNELFLAADPATRARAAQRSFVLVDMQFQDHEWWQAARARPSQPAIAPAWRGAFPRQSGIALARATLVLACNAIRTDPAVASVLLGVSQAVAEVIHSLTFEQIDRISESRFRCVRPRWDDRPAVWRSLLTAVLSHDPLLLAAFDVHAMQLLAGDLLSAPGGA